MKTSILVIGMGAVGTLYSFKCAQAGASVTALCRSDYKQSIMSGITIIHPDASESIFNPLKVIRDINQTSDDYDYIFITTKVLPSIDHIDTLKKVIKPKTAIVCIQNGLLIEDSYKQLFPNNEIIGGLAFVCAQKIGPAKVHHIDYGGIAIGCFPNGKSKKVERLSTLFKQSNIPCRISEMIIFDRYKKLIWNVPFNPLSVIYGGVTTDILLGNSEIKHRIMSIMKEVQSVATADGYALTDDILEKNIQDTLKMKPYKTSMCCDWEAGRPLERQAIVGNIIQKAAQLQIEVPYINQLYDELGQFDKAIT